MSKRKHSNANMLLAVIVGIAYVSLLALFAWQTWQFVSWLFPDDQLLMKVLAVISFDGCALLFGCVHLFYHFASRAAKMWILVGWVVTNVLSAVASIFYLVIESMFRFHLDVSQQTVDVGYAISIIALIFDGVILTFWVYLEWETRHPHHDDFEEFEENETPSVYEQPVKQSNNDPAHLRAELERSLRNTAQLQMALEQMAQSKGQTVHVDFDENDQVQIGPLATTPLDTQQANQMGSQNGKK